jgi:SNF2 family DNA or RNA helicase
MTAAVAPASPPIGGESPPAYKLWQHQEDCIQFCLPKRGALIAAAMGTGKSLMVIELIKRRRHSLTLIIAPKAVAQNVWEGQLERFAPPHIIPTLNLSDGATAKAKAVRLQLWLQKTAAYSRVVVVNYDTTRQAPLAAVLERAGFDFLVLDESHRIKSPSGLTSRVCWRLARKIPWRVALTGTPQPHSVIDWYAQMRALDESVFGASVTQFKASYAGVRYPGSPKVYPMSVLAFGHKSGEKIVIRPEREQEFQQRLGQVAIRVDESVLDLPPVHDIERRFELSPAAQRAYQKLRADMILWLGTGTITPANALVLLLRLQQMTGGWLRDDAGVDHRVDTRKADVLREILDDLPADEPVVVFCKFRADLDAVHEAAVAIGRGTAEISGRSGSERPNSAQWVGDEAVNVGVGLYAWQHGDVPILACQIDAGGLGIDLTRARYAIWYSVGFNAGSYQQARARIHRPGQKGHATYYHLLADHTIDDLVYASLQQKHDAADAVLRSLQRG